MHYKCSECGKQFEKKVDYCECGNNSFIKVFSEKEIAEMTEKKDGALVYVIYVLFFVFLFFGIFSLSKKIMADVNNREIAQDSYIETVLRYIFDEFNPVGIRKSGHCTISFTIDENGEINNGEVIESSNAEELERAIYGLLKNAPSVGRPPAKYINKPIKVDFSCYAQDYEVKCFRKIFVD